MKRNQKSFIQLWKIEFQTPLLVQHSKSIFMRFWMRGIIMRNFLGFFYFLLLISDQKERINQLKRNVNFNPIDCSLDYLNPFPLDKEVSFWPDLLNSFEADLRSPQVELLYRFFKQMDETSNANIIGNADYLLLTNNIDNSGIVWVGPTKQRFDTTKFKLMY